MAIIATGSKTIVDLSDGKSVSVYLGSNLPRSQVYRPDNTSNQYEPDWTGTNLIITPTVYVNQSAKTIDHTGSGTGEIGITWYRKIGAGNKAAVVSGQNGETIGTASNNFRLTVAQNTLAPGSNTPGMITYIASIKYKDPDTSVETDVESEITFTLVRMGSSANLIWISGEQVFKTDANGTTTPASITLTANAQGNASVSSWKYYNGTTWVTYPGYTSGDSLTVTPNDKSGDVSVFINNRLRLRAENSDGSIYDETSVYIVVDGAKGDQGDPAYTAFLTNENITFAAGADGTMAADSAHICNVVAYKGLSKIALTKNNVTVVSGAISGALTVAVDNASGNEVPVTVTAKSGSNLGNAGATGGSIVLKVTDPTNSDAELTRLTITWSKVCTGTSGTSATLLTVYAPEGTVFNNGEAANKSTNKDRLVVRAQFYHGSTDITDSSSVTYLWQKYDPSASGGWAAATGTNNASSYTVLASDVEASATYRCCATYSGVTYYDTITIDDKTDNFQLDVFSSAGDVFKNTVGATCLYTILWQGGKEVDAVKSYNFAEVVPSTAANNALYYVKTTNASANQHTTMLMKYNSSSNQWTDVTSQNPSTYTYKWYRRNSRGEQLDPDGTPFATGKVIFVNGDDVDGKTIFTCRVE